MEVELGTVEQVMVELGTVAAGYWLPSGDICQKLLDEMRFGRELENKKESEKILGDYPSLSPGWKTTTKGYRAKFSNKKRLRFLLSRMHTR